MNNEVKYYHFDDEFNAFIKGYPKLFDTYQDGTKFTIELRQLKVMMYMVRGNVEQHFVIEHPDPLLATLLNDYFIRQRRRHTRGNLYGSFFDLADMFGGLLEYAGIYGHVYQYMDWQCVPFGDRALSLPASLAYIHPATMKTVTNKRGNNPSVEYIQKYSQYEKLRHRLSKNVLADIHFRPGQIFHTTYPLSDPPPVKRSLKLLKSRLWFWKYTLWAGEAGAYSRPRGWAVERSRTKVYSEVVRKNQLISAQIQKNFNLPMSVERLRITHYYDFKRVADYKRDQRIARDYFVGEFNKQVLEQFASRNNIETPPVLVMRGLLTVEQIAEGFDKWEKGTWSDDEFIKNVSNAD